MRRWLLLLVLQASVRYSQVSAEEACPTPTAGLKSKTLNADQPVAIDFYNDGPDNVELVWVNFSGEEKRISVIVAGDKFVESTYAGHIYRLKNMRTGSLQGEHTIPFNSSGNMKIRAVPCVDSAGQGTCPDGDPSCAEGDQTSEPEPPKKAEPPPETPEQKVKRELKEKKRKEKAERRKKDNEKKQARLKAEADVRAAKKKVEDDALNKRKAEARKVRDKEEKEAEKCPAIFDQAGKVNKFGKNTIGKGKCRHRKADKLTRKERREQQLKKMDYTDKLSQGGSKGEKKGSVKDRHKLRMAKRRMMDEFREKNMAVFDHYGRVLKYGQEPLEVKCTPTKNGNPKCKVTEWERRKYRTAEEEKRQKMIQLDRQTEMDTSYGSQSPTAKKKKRIEKENRKRCGVYKEWSDQHKKESDSKKPQFFQWLEQNWEDFQKLRQLHNQRGRGGKANKRKVKSAYRHIALSVHPDKLPKQCSDKDTTDMMRDILTEADRLQSALL